MNVIDKTAVVLSVDVEFSIAGCFADPRLDPAGDEVVRCPIDGRSHGIGFLTETLERHGLRGTFFVEAMQSHFFGDSPMGSIARELHDGGHDVQLHIHPCWRTFADPDWRERVLAAPPNDAMAGRPVAEATELINEGLAIVERWGVPRPIAFRSGSLSADRPLYRAIHAAGLRLASNLGIAVYPPADPSLHLTGGRHWIEEVLEVPILTYDDARLGGWRHRKNLTVCGCSFGEMRSLLESARRERVDTVVLLTHPFEFAKHDTRFTSLRPNRVNQRRFDALCAFLASRPDDFDVVTFGQSAHWLDDGPRAAPSLRVPAYRALGRLVENRFNDAF